MPDVEIKALPAQEAIRFFRSKNIGGRFAFNWQDVEREEHAASFVVAKAMRSDILQVFHSEIDRVLSEGGTIQQAIANVRPELERKGWWGRRQRRDPVTGESGEVQLGSPRRLRTIFNTNLRSARSAGRWERIQRRKKNLPYLMYVDAGDGRVRHQHHLWNGIILPVDHPFWQQYYPPNDFGCRCIVRQLSEAQLSRLGLTVTSEAKLRNLGWGRTVNYTNPRTGQSRSVPDGIRPGFDYNVGQSRLRALSNRPSTKRVEEFGALTSAPPEHDDLLPPVHIGASELLPEGVSDEEAVAAFLSRFDGKLFFDRTQVPLLISDNLFRDGQGRLKIQKRTRARFTPLIAETIKEPDEIWISVEPEGVTRRYLRVIDINGRMMSVIAVFKDDTGEWVSATGFVPEGSTGKRIGYLDRNVRLGTRIYRRGE